MDSGTLIAEVARRDGVLLDKGDPVLVVATAVDVVMTAHRQEMSDYAARMEAAVAAAKPGLSDEALRAMIRDIGTRLAQNQSFFLRAFNWRTLTAALGIVLVAVGIGVAAGWWFFQNQNANALSWGTAAMSQCHDAAIVNGECHPAIKVR